MIINLDADVRKLIPGVQAIHVEDCTLWGPVTEKTLVQPLVEVCHEDFIIVSSHQDGGAPRVSQGLASLGLVPLPV
jgi:hypothetical protein